MSMQRASWRGAIRAALGLSALAATDAMAQENCFAHSALREDADFDLHVQPIFDRYCVSCHQPGGQDFERTGLDLRPGRSYDALVGVRSSLDPNWTLVTPFDLGFLRQSLLLYKIVCQTPPVGERMPPVEILPGEDRILLFSWIQRGAPPGATGSARRWPIEPGLSGTWIDPSAPGQGFSFEVVQQDPPLFVAYWMTYNGFRTPEPPIIAPQAQRWLLGIGNYTVGDGRVTLDVQLPLGGIFDWTAGSNATTQSIGSAVLSFHSCSEATLRYDLNLDGDEAQHAVRSIALRRLTPSDSCQESTEAR